MTTRLSTGMNGLDKLIKGGFKTKTNNLVIGGPGSGKTIFAIQFLMAGLRKGESGMYVTFEEKKEKLYEDMLSFGWDLRKYEKQKKFLFLEYTPEQVKRLIVEGGGAIETEITKIKASRIVIDSISSFALLYKDELTKKEAALALFELINKWGCTSVLTSQEETHSLHSSLEFEADSIIKLYYVESKGIRTRGIEVLKIRGTKQPERIFQMNITNKGLKVLNKLCTICKDIKAN